MKLCRNAEEIKAVSQNVGHEDVGTTMMTYGTLDQHRVVDVIGSMDFTGKGGNDSSNIPASELEALLRKFKKDA